MSKGQSPLGKGNKPLGQGQAPWARARRTGIEGKKATSIDWGTEGGVKYPRR